MVQPNLGQDFCSVATNHVHDRRTHFTRRREPLTKQQDHSDWREMGIARILLCRPLNNIWYNSERSYWVGMLKFSNLADHAKLGHNEKREVKAQGHVDVR